MTGQAIAMTGAAERPREDVTERLGALFDTHHQRLYRLARRLCRSADDARDLVQETFLRAARSPESIPEGHSREEAWLVRVLINICRDAWRRAAVRTRAHAYEIPEISGDNPESAVLARTMVWQALEALAPRRRAVLVMYELEGAAIPSIARLLGISAVTVRWHLSRGRHELADVLRPRSAQKSRAQKASPPEPRGKS
jgi:RNA polymerase sigma-70 factor (ECF subfamily)